MSATIRENHGSQVPYKQRMPASWEHLVASTEKQFTVVPTHDEAMSDHLILDVVGMVDQLDHEELEANRYFALGLLAHKVAEAEQRDPTIRQGLVDRLASMLVVENVKFCKDSQVPADRGLYVDALGITQELHQPLPEVVAAAQELSPAENILLRATAVVALDRVLAFEQHGVRQKVPYEPARYVERVRAGKESVGHLSDAFFVTSIGLAKLALWNRYSTREQPWLTRWLDKKTEPLVRDAVSPQELEALDTTGVARRLASVRLDQLSETSGKISYHPDGRIELDPKAVFRGKSEQDESKMSENKLAVLHENVLGCPALYIRGLIPLAALVTRDAIARADAQIAPRGLWHKMFVR